jgi:hypothetical protein
MRRQVHEVSRVVFAIVVVRSWGKEEWGIIV